MKELLQKIKDGWAVLGAREKKFLSVGGAVVLACVLYQFVWCTLTDSVTLLRERILTTQHVLTAMQALDKDIQQLSSTAHQSLAPTSVVTVLGALQKHINQAGLASALTALKQGSHDAIEMHFQHVDFDKLIRTLITICDEDGVMITQFSATAQKESGTVNADIILTVRSV